MRRAYAASAASNDDKAAASAVKAGAYDEGSDGDEATASAARRAYAASVAADDDNAAASAARHARAAIAARCTAETDEINEGAHNEGSVNDEAEASAVRRRTRQAPPPTTRAPMETRPRQAPQGARTR